MFDPDILSVYQKNNFKFWSALVSCLVGCKMSTTRLYSISFNFSFHMLTCFLLFCLGSLILPTARLTDDKAIDQYFFWEAWHVYLLAQSELAITFVNEKKKKEFKNKNKSYAMCVEWLIIWNVTCGSIENFDGIESRVTD